MRKKIKKSARGRPMGSKNKTPPKGYDALLFVRCRRELKERLAALPGSTENDRVLMALEAALEKIGA